MRTQVLPRSFHQDSDMGWEERHKPDIEDGFYRSRRASHVVVWWRHGIEVGDAIACISKVIIFESKLTKGKETNQSLLKSNWLAQFQLRLVLHFGRIPQQRRQGCNVPNEPITKICSVYGLEQLELITHSVGFSGHMEWPTFELGEILKEDGDKGGDVLCCFFCRALCCVINVFTAHKSEREAAYDKLSIISIWEAYVDGLVDEEYIRVRIPWIWVEFWTIWIEDSARAWIATVSTNDRYLPKTRNLNTPSSMNSPREEEQPGPPFVQNMTSSLSGSFLLSKK